MDLLAQLLFTQSIHSAFLVHVQAKSVLSQNLRGGQLLTKFMYGFVRVCDCVCICACLGKFPMG